jgi:aquaporin Z
LPAHSKDPSLRSPSRHHSIQAINQIKQASIMMDGFRQKFGKALMEAVGTAVLLLTIQLSVGGGSAAAPVAIGLALMAAVYAGGPVSGAHYNPAVSLAVMLRGKQSLHEMIMYWAFQMLGGYTGALLGGIIGGTYSVVSVGSGATATQAFVAEVCFTFVLCFVVLGVATHSSAVDNSYYGVAIGLTVTAGAISVGPISGGAFNPAVALGLCLAKGFSGLGYALVTAGANLLGGACAAFIFYMVAPDQFDAAVGGTAGEVTGLL